MGVCVTCYYHCWTIICLPIFLQHLFQLYKQTFDHAAVINLQDQQITKQFYRILISTMPSLTPLNGQSFLFWDKCLLVLCQHLHCTEFRRFKKLYRTLLIVPWAFPTIVIAFSWQWILNGVYGYLPNLIVKLGLMNHVPGFLTESTWAFICLVFINIWFGAPMIMVNVLSALQTVPEEQFEAARIDGASSWQVFRFVILPHIKVVVGLLVVLRTVWIFNNFDIIYLITGGGPSNATTTLPIFAYNLGWGNKTSWACLSGNSLAILFSYWQYVSFTLE